jgi:tRNA(Leu) C34 or U34 (ribose-2'-O)-methylase TrmL
VHDFPKSIEFRPDFTLNAVSPLPKVRIVLVETSHPGNLGAVARAMKVMGLSDLALVNPQCAIDDEARARASGAADVLESARIFASLDAALADAVLVAACTSRRRDLPHPAFTPRQAAPEILGLARGGPVAVVFGSETFGLSNEQLMKCRWLINIPANPDYASLNLGAAVQVLAYELRATLEDAVLPLPRIRACLPRRPGRPADRTGKGAGGSRLPRPRQPQAPDAAPAPILRQGRPGEGGSGDLAGHHRGDEKSESRS